MAKKDSNGNPLGRSRGIHRYESGVADWGATSAERIREAIVSAANVGGALRFGYSRDGGAYAIGVYGDGEPYTEFVRPSEDVETYLLNVKEFFDGLADAQATARK
jgi:hypothetical protein